MVQGFDIDELISLKHGYQGNKFQWIKTTDKTKLGTLVEVTDVIPGPKIPTPDGPVQKYIAILSDKTRIETDALASNLMMILDDQPPMSMPEILSLQPPRVNTDEIKMALPPDLVETSTLPPEAQRIEKSQEKQSSPEQRSQQRVMTKVNPDDIFGMFSLEDSSISVNVIIKLPARSLLKMMYQNSHDKEKFIDQLTAYINNSVTPTSIRESVKKLVGQQDKKKSTEDAEQSSPTGQD